MWVPGQDASRPATTSPAVRTRAANLPAAPTASVPYGRKDNLIAAAAYLTILPAVFFVLSERLKRNRFIRFHSFQSIFLTLAAIVAAIAMRLLYALLVLIPVLGYLLAWLATAVLVLGWVILWLVLVVKALQGETFRLPWIGSLAERV